MYNLTEQQINVLFKNVLQDIFVGLDVDKIDKVLKISILNQLSKEIPKKLDEEIQFTEEDSFISPTTIRQRLNEHYARTKKHGFYNIHTKRVIERRKERKELDFDDIDGIRITGKKGDKKFEFYKNYIKQQNQKQIELEPKEIVVRQINKDPFDEIEQQKQDLERLEERQQRLEDDTIIENIEEEIQQKKETKVDDDITKAIEEQIRDITLSPKLGIVIGGNKLLKKKKK